MTTFVPLTPIHTLIDALQTGRVTSRALVESALERIASGGGNGGAAFIEVNALQARAQADAIDSLRAAGTPLPLLAGLPISIKDLFDIAGQVTRSGSTLLANAPAATVDAEAVARLRHAGAVLIGRSNMSEFAFSGVGINPHYGTPFSPWDPASRRVPGGSSSGAAVSVTGGMAAAGLGTDTGGSVRIPAALCGIVGFKPTAHRVPRTGALPLSTTLDSIGPLAPTAACCALLDHVLSGAYMASPAAWTLQNAGHAGGQSASAMASGQPAALLGKRLAIVSNYMMDGVDSDVAAAYDRALSRLSAAGAVLTEVRFTPFDDLPTVNRYGFSSMEVYAAHRGWLPEHADQYDPRVLFRIMKGEHALASDYLDLMAARQAMRAAAQQTFGAYDAFLMPTVPIVAPRVDALISDDDAFAATNALLLRNPSAINFLDGCAMSVPCHTQGDAPVGLSITGLTDTDAAILALGQAVDTLFSTAA